VYQNGKGSVTIVSNIPDFFDKYHLPDGEHECTMKEIEHRFLSGEERAEVWGKFTDFLSRLQNLGLHPECILIDGSFVTGRQKPSDVDFGVLIRPDVMEGALESCSKQDKELIKYFMNPDNQYEISRNFGTHLCLAFNEELLNDISYTFRKGLFDELPAPDPERDPPWVKRPKAKGILKVILL
jgi:hypothetical protein